MKEFRPAQGDYEKKLKNHLIRVIAAKLPKDMFRTFDVNFCLGMVVVTAVTYRFPVNRPEERADAWISFLNVLKRSGFKMFSFHCTKLPPHVRWMPYVAWAAIDSIETSSL